MGPGPARDKGTFQKIDSFASSDVWEGDLAEKRSDRGVSR